MKVSKKQRNEEARGGNQPKRVTKAVSFNLDDPFERMLYEYAMEQTTNFSGYTKHLIYADKIGAIRFNPSAAEVKKEEPEKKVEEPDFDENDIGGICD